VSAGGYAWVGRPDAWQIGPEAGSLAQPDVAAMGQGGGMGGNGGTGNSAAPHAMTTDQITAMVDGLASKLKADPGNAEGWAMLARTYATLSRFEEATAAYRKALALRTDDAQLHADFADALAVTQGRKLQGEPAELVAKALKLDPNNFKALSLSGTIAFEKQDYQGTPRPGRQPRAGQADEGRTGRRPATRGPGAIDIPAAFNSDIGDSIGNGIGPGDAVQGTHGQGLA